jgi:Fe-S cluster assembly protein SufD
MKTVVETIDTKKKFLDLYQENREIIAGSEPSQITELRDRAIKHFEELGFPKRKDEKYKYSHLEPLFNGDLSIKFVPRKLEFDLEEIFRCDVPTLNADVLTVLNGHYHSNTGEKLVVKENGVIYGSLAEAIKQYPELVLKHYGKHAALKDEPFVSLNTACSKDGVFVYVPENQVMEKPVQIIHLLLSDQNEMVQHRNLFIAEKNSTAEIIICDHTLSPHLFLTNSVSEISIGENADLDVLRLQNEHNNSVQITNTWINQQRSSMGRHSTITLHGGKVRNNLNVKLAGEGARNDALGLYILDKQQHVDNFTVIEHQSPNCTSNQHYKGVLDDAATGAFTGKIHVFEDAQKTEAFQTNKNILLTKDAKMHTKPQLEIYADDVKCSHGATVGQIDENALFYLQARGIPKEEARLMMMFAFASEVIKGIKAEVLRIRMQDLVNKRLRGELSRCKNCVIHCTDNN